MGQFYHFIKNRCTIWDHSCVYNKYSFDFLIINLIICIKKNSGFQDKHETSKYGHITSILLPQKKSILQNQGW